MTSSRLRDLVNPPDRVRQYREQGLWTDDTLASRVRHHAEVTPDVPAVIDRRGDRVRSYADLARDASVVARRLAGIGVGVGEVVSVQLPNCYEAVVSAVAAQSLGAVLNPLLPDYRARELTYVFETARPLVVITPSTYRDWDFTAMIAEIRRRSGISFVHVTDGDGGDLSLQDILDDTADTVVEATPSEVSELIFTSGTEASPKAIMHTEQNANLAVRTLFEDLGISATAVVWMPSPLGHSTGFNYGVRAALFHGRTLILQDRWNAADAIELVRRFGCNYTLAATTFLRDLVEECERTGVELSSLTHFGCGGAPVPPSLVERAAAVGIVVLRLYGSTEVLCASWNRPGDAVAKRMHTDGRALSHTEIEIRDESGARLAPGNPGELCIRGPQSSVGLFEDSVRTQATYLEDGWIRSGDLAELDADGHLTIVGRKKEILIRGGVNIAPREIEDMLVSFEEVERAAVVGIPDERLGERLCAVLVLRPGRSLDLGTVVDRLRESGLATYKLPQMLRIVSDFPMTPSGKVQKHEIVKRLTAESDLEEPEVPAVTPTEQSLPEGDSTRRPAPVVLCERLMLPGAKGAVALITLNRPDQLNSISWEMIDAIDAAVTEAMGLSDVRAILVTGRGRAFSAGGDLKAYQELQRDTEQFPRFVAALHTVFGRLRTLDVPVIALVNGVTVAGGLELLLNCDIALAGRSARIADGHLNFGQMGGGGVLTLLPRYVGLARASELILSGRFLSADEAAEWGIVSRVVPDDELLDEGIALAQSIALKSPLAVANAKYVLTSVWSEGMSVRSGLQLERERNSLYCLTSQDAPEGLAAFAEKREPKFTGR